MPKKKDRHVMEALGKTRVVVENGKVVEVGQPQTDYCPIFAKVRNIRQFTPESVKGNIEFRIKDFGMFTGRREIEMERYYKHFTFGNPDTDIIYLISVVK